MRLSSPLLPEWRNGRRRGLKIRPVASADFLANTQKTRSSTAVLAGLASYVSLRLKRANSAFRCADRPRRRPHPSVEYARGPPGRAASTKLRRSSSSERDCGLGGATGSGSPRPIRGCSQCWRTGFESQTAHQFDLPRLLPVAASRQCWRGRGRTFSHPSSHPAINPVLSPGAAQGLPPNSPSLPATSTLARRPEPFSTENDSASGSEIEQQRRAPSRSPLFSTPAKERHRNTPICTDNKNKTRPSPPPPTAPPSALAREGQGTDPSSPEVKRISDNRRSVSVREGDAGSPPPGG